MRKLAEEKQTGERKVKPNQLILNGIVILILTLGAYLIDVLGMPALGRYLKQELHEVSFEQSRINLDDPIANTVYRYIQDCGSIIKKRQCAMSVEYRIRKNKLFAESDREYAKLVMHNLLLNDSNTPVR